MIELKCRKCDTGIFRVEDIARGLGELPLSLTCHICGIQYLVKPDETGSPAVFYRKGKGRYRKMGISGLAPAPAPEPTEVNPGVTVTTGTYVGNDVADRAIPHGLGVIPKTGLESEPEELPEEDPGEVAAEALEPEPEEKG